MSRATGLHCPALLGDPVAQVGVDKGLQLGFGERVVDEHGREALFVAVPHMPEEGALLKAGHMLLKELVAQPLRQGHAVATGIAQQGGLARGRPVCAKGAGQHGTQPVHQRRLAAHRGQAGNAIVVAQVSQDGVLGDGGAGRIAEFHGGIQLCRPAIAQHTSQGHLQRVGRGLGVAVENPLRRVVGIGFGQAVGVAFGGDLLPVGEVERNV